MKPYTATSPLLSLLPEDVLVKCVFSEIPPLFLRCVCVEFRRLVGTVPTTMRELTAEPTFLELAVSDFNLAIDHFVLNSAVACNHIAALNWILQTSPEVLTTEAALLSEGFAIRDNVCGLDWCFHAGLNIPGSVWLAAAGSGAMEVLRWLLKMETNMMEGDESGDWSDEDWWEKRLACFAVRHERIDALQFLHSHAQDEFIDVAIEESAFQGKRIVLEYIENMYTDVYIFDAAIVAMAAAGGQLELLQWMKGRGAAFSRSVLFEAAKAGHVHVLDWALRQFPAFGKPRRVFKLGINHMRSCVVRYCLEHDFQIKQIFRERLLEMYREQGDPIVVCRDL